MTRKKKTSNEESPTNAESLATGRAREALNTQGGNMNQPIRICTPTIKTAVCACGRFVSTRSYMCNACGSRLDWDNALVAERDNTVPPPGTQARASLEWACIEDIRDRLRGTLARVSFASPADLAALVSMTLDALSAHGVAVAPASIPASKGARA